MRSLSELVARSSSEFPWANATNPIAPVCLIIVLCLLKWTRVLLARRIFQRLRMGDFHEKHTYMKFCFKLGKSFRRLFEMLEQAFGDEAMSRTQTHEWCKCFKEVQNSVEDNDRSWPTSTYKKWRKHPKSSKGDSFKSSSDTLWSSRRSWNLKKKFHEILTEYFGMHRVAAKFVQRRLSEDQKQNRVYVSLSTVQMLMITS